MREKRNIDWDTISLLLFPILLLLFLGSFSVVLLTQVHILTLSMSTIVILIVISSICSFGMVIIIIYWSTGCG